MRQMGGEGMSEYERFKDLALRMTHGGAGETGTAYALIALAEKVDELIQAIREERR